MIYRRAVLSVNTALFGGNNFLGWIGWRLLKKHRRSGAYLNGGIFLSYSFDEMSKELNVLFWYYLLSYDIIDLKT